MTQINTEGKYGLKSVVGNTKPPLPIDKWGNPNGKITNVIKNNKRIRSRCWFFTWNNPMNGAVTQLKDTFKYWEVDYVFQMEKGETPHLQGAIYFKNAVGIAFQKELYHGKIHWEKGRSWKNCKTYCCKLDTRIDGPWTNLKTLKWRKTIKDPLKGKTLYEFQKKILNLIQEEPNDRSIWWFWDSKGNSGKSSLCKHIKMKYGANAIMVSGGAKDIMFAVKMRLTNNIDIDIVMVDIPRSMMDYISYAAIEKLKNGYAFSGKYESAELIMNSPHVICFANAEPARYKMSLDRWKIIDIDNHECSDCMLNNTKMNRIFEGPSDAEIRQDMNGIDIPIIRNMNLDIDCETMYDKAIFDHPG